MSDTLNTHSRRIIGVVLSSEIEQPHEQERGIIDEDHLYCVYRGDLLFSQQKSSRKWNSEFEVV